MFKIRVYVAATGLLYDPAALEALSDLQDVEIVQVYLGDGEGIATECRNVAEWLGHSAVVKKIRVGDVMAFAVVTSTKLTPRSCYREAVDLEETVDARYAATESLMVV